MIGNAAAHCWWEPRLTVIPTANVIGIPEGSAGWKILAGCWLGSFAGRTERVWWRGRVRVTVRYWKIPGYDHGQDDADFSNEREPTINKNRPRLASTVPVSLQRGNHRSPPVSFHIII